MSAKQYVSGTLLVLMVFLTSYSACASKTQSPYRPEEALQTFQLPEGFQIELVAAEPEVMDPVAIAFDERGRLFVVEMPDYPLGNRTGRIKLLEDRDGDARFEFGTVFAENLGFPNGVMPWKDGVLVSAAPDIFYLADTDGDNRADMRQVVLTGFAATNPQLRINGLVYGLDNWIYAAYPRAGGSRRYGQFDDRGQAIHFPKHPEVSPVEISPGTDFRFRPEQMRLEAVGGMSQFGNAFDAWRNRFTVWNNDHVRHVVIEARYLSRNPYLAVVSAMKSISDHGNAAVLYPITQQPFHIHESEIGHFTSACGTSVYTAGNFPEEYRGAFFVCDPVHNVVHCDLLFPDGISFVAKRAQKEAEFVASTDSWFHPVFTTVGPDGALYVVDFYRKLVEHPEFIPHADEQGFYVYQGVLSQADFLEGHELGRIYRIVHTSRKPGSKSQLHQAATSELVEQLSNSNMWWRITAQRLLVDRQDPSAIPALEDVARHAPSAEAYIHALWTLEGLGGLGSDLVARALENKNPKVREQAIRLAEKHLPDSKLQRKLFEMTSDPDDRVQFQLACTLSQLPSGQSFNPLKQLVIRHLEDPWFQVAVLTSASENATRWLRAAVTDFMREQSKGKEEFVRRITSIIGAGEKNREISEVLDIIGRAKGGQGGWWRAAALKGLSEGLERGSESIQLSPAAQSRLIALLKAQLPEVRKAALEVMARVELSNSYQVREVVRSASRMAHSQEAEPEDRANATKLLGLDPSGSTIPILRKLLTPAQPEQVQVAAAAALAKIRNSKVGTQILLEKWQTYTASVKEVVLRTFFSEPDRLHALLDAIETGKVQPWFLDRSSRARLLRFPDREIRRRAGVLLADFANDDARRQEVLKKYHPALQMSGNLQHGEEIFKEKCSGCHRIGAMGVEVGPDLLSLTKQTKQYLLTEILDPNGNLVPGYEEYLVRTRDGRLITGVLAEDTPTTLTLRRTEGEEDTILRSNIASLRLSSVSQMPEDWVEGMSVQDMADLLQYLKSVAGRGGME
ncbi:MAG: PVC-type heme-binding CxxCH protein [Acidobacteriota bacterium]